MRLQDVLDDEACIVPQMAAADTAQAIDELVGALVAARRVAAADRDAVVAAVCAREATMSTGIGNGVAIPHAASDRVQRPAGAIGISRTGIDFAALDGQPVHIVVLLVVPEGQFQLHLDTLADIARVLGDVGRRARLRDAGSAADVLAIVGA
jgi:mannitol/fructose-specific phosphotransferase system IIA component (Ntr-type)